MFMCSLPVTGTSFKDRDNKTPKRNHGISRKPAPFNCASTSSSERLAISYCKTKRRLKAFIMTASFLFNEEHKR